MKNFIRAAFLFLLPALLVSFAAAAENGASFTAGTFSVDAGSMNYYLFAPQNASKDMPLLIYLHGGSGKGDDLSLLTENGFCKWVSEGCFDDVPAYILFPQLSSSYKGWANAKQTLKALIDDVVKNHSIDKTRISLTGHSMGGTGAFSFAAAYPRLFSAVAPMSGSISCSEENLAALKYLPLWAVVGENDTIVDPQSSKDFVTALQAQGSTAKLTVLKGATHFTVPELAYLDKELDIVGWLIGQTRENLITACDGIDVSVCAQLPGTYTLILAHYLESGAFAGARISSCTLAYGDNAVPVPSGFSLTRGDKLFLVSPENFAPLCPSFIVQ